MLILEKTKLKKNGFYKISLASMLIFSKLCKKKCWNKIDPQFCEGFYEKTYISDGYFLRHSGFEAK